MEWLARGTTIRMGGQASIAEYSMDGATAKRVSIPGTMTLARQIGGCLREARGQHRDPFAALIELLPSTHYRFGKILFQGKIVDICRATRQGFAIGRAVIQGLDDWNGTLEITFQNENLIARIDGEVKAIVPDLICILDSETAEPITTEWLRYGQRVTAMGVSVPEIMRSPEALAIFGPAAFGLDEPFTPLETLA
jgi:hypothetical protein